MSVYSNPNRMNSVNLSHVVVIELSLFRSTLDIYHYPVEYGFPTLSIKNSLALLMNHSHYKVHCKKLLITSDGQFLTDECPFISMDQIMLSRY